MITATFYSSLRLYAGVDKVDIDVEEIDIHGLLSNIRDVLRDDVFYDKVVEANGKLRKGVLVLVNGQSILNMDHMNTIVKNNDSVSFFPLAVGG